MSGGSQAGSMVELCSLQCGGGLFMLARATVGWQPAGASTCAPRAKRMPASGIQSDQEIVRASEQWTAGPAQGECSPLQQAAAPARQARSNHGAPAPLSGLEEN